MNIIAVMENNLLGKELRIKGTTWDILRSTTFQMSQMDENDDVHDG